MFKPIRQAVLCDHLGNLSQLVGLIVVAVGAAVLVGWQFDLESLKRILPSLVAMNPATAVTFILAGVALWLLADQALSMAGRRVAIGLAGAVMLVGLLKLLGYFGGWDILIDRLLFADRLDQGGPVTSDGTNVPNRMAPNTAMLFVLTGINLALVGFPSSRTRLVGKMVALVVALLALVAIIGYLSDITSLYRPTVYIPIALNTAVTFLMVAVGAAMLGVSPVSDVASDRRLIRIVENNIVAGFTAALFMVAVIGIVSYASIRDFASDSRLNEHSQAVIATVAELASELKDVEAGARGFVITGDETFLKPYDAAREQLPQKQAKLLALTADNPHQRAWLAELAPLIEDKLAFVQQAVEIRRHEGFEAARRTLATRSGKQKMDRARAVLDQMRSHEIALLDVRSRSTAQSAAVAVTVITVGSLLVFAVVAGSGWLIRKDMALRQATEAELRRTRDAAEAANHAKSQFLANMSHEIRTPMTAIIGYADLLLDARQNDSDRLNCANTIRRNGEHLLTLINDILDLSKIEAGMVEIERIACSPCRVISDVTSLMRVRASEKALLFEAVTQGPLPATIHTDPTRLRQILINLIGNAIKFTDAGWVRLHVKLEPDETGRELLRFDVIDTGIGMTPEQVDKLFRPFGQVDCSMTRRFGGTGLGLSICKPLAEKLGGRIEVDSTPGRGSTFTIWIDPGPLEGVPRLDACVEAMDVEEGSADGADEMPTLQGHILLVDDGVDNRQLLSVYLRQAGAEVSLAENGQIGCDKALAAMADDKPYDLVLMDMQMPVLDGYGAAARLRAKGYDGPIVALTAHAMAEDRIKCLNAGCTDYLTKPIRRHDLLRALACHFEQGEPGRGGMDETDREVEIAPQPAAGGNGVSASNTPLCPEDLDESVQPYLDSFIRHLPEQVAELQMRLEQADVDQLAVLTHKLKGTGGLYGLMPITDTATEVEARIREGESLDAVAAKVDELVALMRRVQGYDQSRETAQRSRLG